MGFFRKNKDPISARARTLQAEIESLEVQIRKLDAALQQESELPRLRSSTRPASSAPLSTTPYFEPVERRSLEQVAEPQNSSSKQKEIGVRKYDPLAQLKRLRNHFRGPGPSNPKLVSYLAAGSIKGLRPLRYEKRVARNRFIALFFFLMLLLSGIVAVFRSS
jgi:hypothetical protein